MFVDGEEVEAQLVGYDKTFDVAVLKVEKTDLKPLKLGDSEAVRNGKEREYRRRYKCLHSN